MIPSFVSEKAGVRSGNSCPSLIVSLNRRSVVDQFKSWNSVPAADVVYPKNVTSGL